MPKPLILLMSRVWHPLKAHRMIPVLCLLTIYLTAPKTEARPFRISRSKATYIPTDLAHDLARTKPE